MAKRILQSESAAAFDPRKGGRFELRRNTPRMTPDEATRAIELTIRRMVEQYNKTAKVKLEYGDAGETFIDELTGKRVSCTQFSLQYFLT